MIINGKPEVEFCHVVQILVRRYRDSKSLYCNLCHGNTLQLYLITFLTFLNMYQTKQIGFY